MISGLFIETFNSLFQRLGDVLYRVMAIDFAPAAVSRFLPKAYHGSDVSK
jgi:hypothetical protein